MIQSAAPITRYRRCRMLTRTRSQWSITSWMTFRSSTIRSRVLRGRSGYSGTSLSSTRNCLNKRRRTGLTMSMRRRGRRFRQLRSYARTCSTRSRRLRLICLHSMMSSCRPQLDWPSSRIISWLQNWSINQNRRSNSFQKTTRWSLKSRYSKEISRFTKRLKRSWLRGLIPAKR